MYMIEISESKYDNLVDHVSKSIKCLGKVMQCLEELDSSEDESNMDDEYLENYNSRNSHSRNRVRGRYSRY